MIGSLLNISDTRTVYPFYAVLRISTSVRIADIISLSKLYETSY